MRAIDRGLPARIKRPPGNLYPFSIVPYSAHSLALNPLAGALRQTAQVNQRFRVQLPRDCS